jgi:hypothetical protein
MNGQSQLATLVNNVRSVSFLPGSNIWSRAVELMQRLPERAARYVLGLIYLHGAVDGVLQIFFHVYYTGEQDPASFVGVLQHTKYFWAFMKLCQLLGAVSLLMNYKPALGFVLLAPISVVLCLFYLFAVQWYGYVFLIAGSSLILLWTYAKSFRPLLEDYP